jgi:hypothetical protein
MFHYASMRKARNAQAYITLVGNLTESGHFENQEADGR